MAVRRKKTKAPKVYATPGIGNNLRRALLYALHDCVGLYVEPISIPVPYLARHEEWRYRILAKEAEAARFRALTGTQRRAYG